MKNIAITGQTGVGKTTIAWQVMRGLNEVVNGKSSEICTILDYDKIAKKCTAEDTNLKQELLEIGIDSSNKNELSNIIFDPKNPLKKVAESLIHDSVFSYIDTHIKNFKNYKFLIHDIPLIPAAYERGLKFDKVYLIKSSDQIRLDRLVNSRYIDEKYAMIMIDNSIELSEYQKYSDIEFDSGDFQTQEIVNDIIENIRKNYG
ncbi:MAG: dephospho-CoA kinase [Bifidobacteriaceae bacterium]|jgi:dephospho-CoA kinase|nr:dephospho-CoA kinase [Bifidobacteriaceae bacterium]